MIRPSRHSLSVTSIVVVAAASSFAAFFAFDVTRHKEPLPSDLAAPVAALLTPGDGARVTFDKNTTLDFWWTKALPLKAGSTNVTWSEVEEGTIVGAVRVSADFRDIRGRETHR